MESPLSAVGFFPTDPRKDRAKIEEWYLRLQTYVMTAHPQIKDQLRWKINRLEERPGLSGSEEEFTYAPITDENP